MKKRVTTNKVLKFYKVQWQNHSADEATWEQESYILEHCPHLLLGMPRYYFMLKAYSYPFPTLGTHMKSLDEILFNGGEL